jgi:Rieske 2Fe-2S family protein
MSASFYRPGVRTQTISGEFACKRLLLQDVPAPGVVPSAYGRFGLTTAVLAFPDYCVTFIFRPIDEQSTEVASEWFVHEEAEEETDYNVSDVIGLWDTTNRQDWKICEANYDGITSRTYTPGPHSLIGEPAVREFLRIYLNAMRQRVACI